MTEGKQILTMFSSADEAIVVGEGKSKSQDLCNIISPTQKGLDLVICPGYQNEKVGLSGTF